MWLSCKKSEKEGSISMKLLSLLSIFEPTENVQKECIKVSHYFCLRMNKLRQKSSIKRQRFVEENKNWLEAEVYMIDSLLQYISQSNTLRVSGTSRDFSGCSRGRPQLAFEECTLQTKRRRVKELLKTHSLQELTFAAHEFARLSGTSSDYHLKPKTLPVEETLALILDLDLSERKYNVLRSVVNNMHNECFPSMYKIKKYRNDLLPKNINISESGAEVDLQELLNNTVHSILKIIKDDGNVKNNISLTLICKYGFNGSSGHSIYRQKFIDPNMTDEYVFFIAMSPLNLVDRDTNKVLWNNPRSSSTFFCRPIKFIFSKETSQLILQEDSLIKKKIDDLKELKVTQDEKNISVNYTMLFTMLDGSSINTLSHTNAAQRCFICGASPKEMNTNAVLEKKIIKENMRFGLSSLHSWIRCLECLLHISYRLPLKRWQVF